MYESDDIYDDDLEDDEADDDATMPCPYCRAEIYDDSERCPRCGNYLAANQTTGRTDGGHQFTKQPLWIIITALLCIYAMLHMYLWPLLMHVFATE